MKLKSGSDLSDKSLRASFQVCRVFDVEALQGGALSLDETVVNHGDVAVVLVFFSNPFNFHLCLFRVSEDGLAIVGSRVQTVKTQIFHVSLVLKNLCFL
ncbi:hypothetical protein F2Q69_00061383 [Brassica cretica]|uniref:Uncharacterized protein n=1 Tax=Brassica cretica TaxID=69181 RepID=A0A8S9REF2_BRACR|nr:hypothetical protein F2Q69_00061383 [Brassica cretica]